ncbi:MAG: nucleoside triphosphate pyrophosphohydrolase [Gammaproteobacteria bacterium]|nr:nucleoside triphosphate pyrophosphohydrolase [Gammaproteobacteria bacterium]
MTGSTSNEQLRYTIADLQELMRRLRDPVNGCPWDIVQSYRTIAPSTLEEAYEVVDAIEQENYQHLKEELGDLLFQIIFYTQLASEEQRFTFDGVVSDLVSKLVRRHPHVFPDNSLASFATTPRTAEEEQAIKQRWEQLKQEEREAKGHAGVLDDIPVSLPALSRAAKLQKRASAVGFDWPDISGVVVKIEEELDEVKQAIASGDGKALTEELGDLMFAVVNACRHARAEPESALRYTNSKFEQRFRFIEDKLRERGISPQDASLELMDDLWEQAKSR